MEDREPEDSGTKLDEEDEWQLYASAGYASSESENENEDTQAEWNRKKSGSTAMISTSKEAR